MSKNKKSGSSKVYEDRLCLFMDILGFRQHIEESGKDEVRSSSRSHWSFTVPRIHSALSAIHRAMNNRYAGLVDDDDVNTKQVTQFSDSIVVSYRLDDEHAIFSMLYDIYLLQIDLIQHRILVRGAITAGKLFHDNNLVFGPALVDAADLEKLAMYPRVIISHEILSNYKMDGEESIMSLLKEDLDGMFFIDYFGVSPGTFDNEWDGVYQHLIELRELIKRMSQLTRNPSIKLKHSWLRQKYNDIARPLEKSGYRELSGRSVPYSLKDQIQNLSPFR